MSVEDENVEGDARQRGIATLCGGSLWTPVLLVAAANVGIATIVLQWAGTRENVLVEAHYHEYVGGALQGCFVGNGDVVSTSIIIGSLLAVVAVFPRSPGVRIQLDRKDSGRDRDRRVPAETVRRIRGGRSFLAFTAAHQALGPRPGCTWGRNRENRCIPKRRVSSEMPTMRSHCGASSFLIIE